MQPGLHILVLTAFTFSAALRAESVADYQAALEQSIQSQANTTAEAPQIQPAASITPATPQQPQDRKKGNSAAKALAMAGAAMALASCAKLMKDAQDAKAAGNTETAAMLESMAMQQCAQGLKDMGAAQDNGDNANQLSQSDIPKMAQLTAQPLATSKSNPSEVTIAPPTGGATPTTPNFEEPSPTPEAANPNDDPDAVGTKPIAGPEYSKTILSPIEQGELRFDDSAKAGGFAPATGNSFYSSQSSPKVPTSDESKKALEKEAEERRKRAAADGEGDDGEGGGGSGSGSGSTTTKEGGENSFEAMMSQMFGAPPGAAGAAAGAAGDLAGFEAKAGEDGAKSNIFQYASYRYQVAAYSDNRIKLKTMPKQPTRQLASAFSAELAAVMEGAVSPLLESEEPEGVPAKEEKVPEAHTSK